MPQKTYFTQHAIQEMLNDNIDIDVVIDAAHNGRVIEEYANDKPFPSALKLHFSGFLLNNPVHVVCATDNNGYIRIITTYKPDPELWTDNYTTRKPKAK